jgi:glucose-1-phosphate cytidylyltransferase
MKQQPSLADIPVFILCGGLGTRIKEETEFRPKPMVPIGEHPILWHVMQSYARHGFRRFVLCLGFKADAVKDYFSNFHLHNADCTIKLKTNEVTVHEHRQQLDWEVTLAYTGEKNMTGSRVAQAARKYLGKAKHFAVTYGDGLSNIDINASIRAHRRAKKICTLSAVHPAGRFGSLKIEDNGSIHTFNEKPQFEQDYVNGGYMVCHRNIFNYLTDDPNVMLEREPVAKLVADGQLHSYRHEDFWQPMDTYQESQYLNKLWAEGKAPWKIW